MCDDFVWVCVGGGGGARVCVLNIFYYPAATTHTPSLEDLSPQPNTLGITQTPSTGLQHPSLEEGAGKRCSECGDHTHTHTYMQLYIDRWIPHSVRVLHV